MTLESILDDLDTLYVCSLDEPVSQSDRDFICDKMERIAASCDNWLDCCPNLTGDLRNRFAALKRKALATIAETKQPCDVLLHWCSMRSEMLEILAEIEKGRKVVA